MESGWKRYKGSIALGDTFKTFTDEAWNFPSENS